MLTPSLHHDSSIFPACHAHVEPLEHLHRGETSLLPSFGRVMPVAVRDLRPVPIGHDHYTTSKS